MIDETLTDLREALARVEGYSLMAAKSVFSFEEAAKFLNLSKSYLYKMTSRNEIPFYRPNGKLLYFEKAELEKWLRSNRVASVTEIAEQAETYVATKPTPRKGGAR